MANKVTTISDLINCVASSCLNHRIPPGLRDYDDDDDDQQIQPKHEEKEEQGLRIWAEEEEDPNCRKLKQMEAFVHQVFDAYAAVKRAYVTLQSAHSPWDPDKMRAADAAVVAELRNLGRLRDQFRRAALASPPPAPPLRDAVAPYEAALEDLKRDLRSKDAQLQSLKDKLQALAGSNRRTRHASGNRVGCITVLGSPTMATPELLETYMDQVKTTLKSFTGNLLSLMRGARWDIPAAVKSILSSSGDGPAAEQLDPRHAKYALESYVSRKLFHGFENETFYMEGSLGSLLKPAEFRRDCFAQFRDMRGMDPVELLGILPTCQLGRFAAAKYAAVMHARMEESLFGGVEQRRLVMAGGHPRTTFYADFLQVAKAVWMLHLLAFAMEPAPGHFEAARGAEFHPQYMESVVRFGSGRVPPGLVVGFAVGPGFRLGNGTVIKSRVYLVNKF